MLTARWAPAPSPTTARSSSIGLTLLLFPTPSPAAGGITNLGNGTSPCRAANTYNGPIAVHSGTLTLSGNQTVNSTDVFVIAVRGDWHLVAQPNWAFRAGWSVGSGTTIHLSGSTAAPDFRCTLLAAAGTNTFNGPIVLDGSGVSNTPVRMTRTEFVYQWQYLRRAGFCRSFFLRGGGGSGIHQRNDQSAG